MLVRMLRAPGKRASRRRFSLETRAALFRLSRDEIGRRVAKQGGILARHAGRNRTRVR